MTSEYLLELELWNSCEEKILRNNKFFEADLTDASVEEIESMVMQ